MGTLTVCARIYVVVANILFLLVGLALFATGLIFRFGDSITSKYLDSSLDSLKTAIDNTGVGDSTEIYIDMNKLLFDVSIGFIGTGLLLGIVAFLGCFGACCKVKKLLILYVIVCFALLVGQIVVIVLLYLTTIIQDKIKTTLKESAKISFEGLAGTSYQSVAWNVLMIYGDCCGVESYDDFTHSLTWNDTAYGVNQDTPLACCVTLPSSNDYSCAVSPLDAALNNYQTLLLIISGIAAICSLNNNKQAKVAPVQSQSKPRHKRHKR